VTIRDVAAYLDILVRLVLALAFCAVLLSAGFLVLGLSLTVALGIARRLAWIAIPIALIWSLRPIWEQSARSSLERAGEVYIRVAMSIVLGAGIGDALGVISPSEMRSLLYASGVLLVPLAIGLWVRERYKMWRRRGPSRSE
jgi:hypothetical protein